LVTQQTLLKLLKEEYRFLITTHESPDGDALGSEIALALGLKSIGKDVIVVNEDKAEQRYNFIDSKIDIVPPENLQDNEQNLNTTMLVLDTLPDNTGKKMQMLQRKVSRIISIDHHDTNQASQLPQGYYQPKASSTCEMVYDLLKALNVKIDLSMGEAIFTGMVYDTGSFRYKKTGSHTLFIGSELVKLGVNPFKIHTIINQSNTKASLILHSRVLSTLEFFQNDRIALITMPKDMLIESGSTFEESQTIINIPLGCRSVEVSIFFKQDETGRWKCSLRSKGHFNCLNIAEPMGGGGHSTAAGFKLKEPMEMIRQRVLESMEQLLT
jgi:phosphoesterase RecJ-like protein